MIKLSIDGELIEVQPGTSVIEAALANGIDIPRLCFHPDLSVSGGCRLCLVEIDGIPDPKPSCGLLCEEGMAVRTQSELLYNLRRQVIDIFLSEHPLDCVTCEKSGACQLQRYAYEMDIKETSYEFTQSRTLYQDDNPFFIRDHQYCILCGRCVRVCDEIVGVHAIDFTGRGFNSHISTPFDGPMIDSTCVFCGNCVQICPTAALMPVSRRRGGREWELQPVTTTCVYCGVGCQVEHKLKDGAIVYAQAPPGPSVNGDFLCTKGRFGWDFASNPERLTKPMIRRDIAYKLGVAEEPWELPEISPLAMRRPNVDEYFVPVEWDEALSYIADQLSKIVKDSGPDAVMGLASARCTNEENYLFQKFMRAGIGTNNVDHCARL
jgi:NADH-quinone oxidoreductase subunit G